MTVFMPLAQSLVLLIQNVHLRSGKTWLTLLLTAIIVSHRFCSPPGSASVEKRNLIMLHVPLLLAAQMLGSYITAGNPPDESAGRADSVGGPAPREL